MQVRQAEIGVSNGVMAMLGTAPCLAVMFA
jgi:hypothetical protein